MLLAMLMVSQIIDAQLHLTAFNDLGKNNVSEGLFVKTGITAHYNLGKNSFGYGNHFNLKSQNPNFFSGVKGSYTRMFQIKGTTYKATAFFMYNLVSGLIHETNWGAVINNDAKHFSYMMGVNFRTSHITRKAIEEYEINSNTKSRDKWNLMYNVGYNLKPSGHIWNTGLSLTNTDYFFINQDTNPMIKLDAKYRLQVPLTLYVETWYKTAGVFNISADSFGFFIRTGLIWELF